MRGVLPFRRSALRRVRSLSQTPPRSGVRLVLLEGEIRQAMHFALTRLKIVVEPSGATGLAALLSGRIRRPRRRIGVIVSGGNLDLRRLITAVPRRSIGSSRGRCTDTRQWSVVPYPTGGSASTDLRSCCAMDRHEQFRSAAIDRDIPEDEAGKFAEQLRFAIWAGPSGAGDDVAGQFGGLPRLPVGVEWPGGGDPLPFIGSVDCAALPRTEGLGLPADGSLLFFLHHEEDMEEHPTTEFSRALYVPAGAETEVALPPPGHDTRTFFHEDIPFLIPERRLAAWVQPVLPDWIEERDVEFEADTVKQLFDELKHIDQLCELVDELWPDQDRYCTLRIGGYCREIGGQDGPWTQMAFDNVRSRQAADPDMSRAERVRLRHEEEYRLIREWVPLAQFPTESEVYYGCFLISSDDLAAKRFGQMRSFTMFTE